MSPPSLLRRSLTPQPVTVPLGRWQVTVPAYPAARWIDAVMDEETETAILPGLLDGRDAERLLDLVEAGRIAPGEVSRGAFRALTEASGRDWWETVRLVGAVDNSSGQLLGELTLRGVDPDRMPLARWVAAVYALLVRGLDEKKLLAFNTKLMLVPDLPGLEIDEKPTDAEEIARMLASMPGVSIGG